MKYVVCLIILLCGEAVFANDISGSMKEFWEASGGVTNYNGPTAYEAQAAGYYTLGNFYARTPVLNTQIASVSLPSMKSGCGGIDIHKGAFSFINAPAIVNTLKAIANNSAAFAMQLAMETISPVTAEKIEELQTWMQRINSLNINSCEAAASLVGGIWPRHERASSSICSALANSSGVASDYTQARHECHINRKAAGSKVSKEEREKLMFEDVNLAWKALKESGVISLNEKAGSDKTLAELMMTLSGTIIIRTHGDVPKFEYVASRIDHSDIIGAMLEGGEITSHICDDVELCLNVRQNAGKQHISHEAAFKAKVEKLILNLVDKIQTDTPLNDEEKKFLNNKAQIPIYKVLNVYAAYSGASALFELPVYSQAISLQLLFEYLGDVLRQVEIASDTLVIASDDHLKQFKNNLRSARRALAERELKTYNSYMVLMKLVDRAMSIERILADQIGGQVAASFNWGHGL